MEWKTAWSYLPIYYNTTIGTVEDMTQRTFIKNNLNAKKVKVKFSNRYGTQPLVLDKVILAKRKSIDSQIEQFTPLTVSNNEQITLLAGEECYSDTLSFELEAGSEIVVSIYIKEKTNVESACSTWAARSWHTVYGLQGDYTTKQNFEEKESRDVYPFVEADVNKANIVVGIAEIKLYTEDDVKTVTLFGDSITHMSYYSDVLIERLYQDYPGKITVLNRGIGGNRVLHDATYVTHIPGEGKFFGTAAIRRFEADVYESDTPECVILLEGVNDLLHPYLFLNKKEAVTAQQLQEGFSKLIAIAHKKGSRIYLGTIMPFYGDDFEGIEVCEQTRVELNEWIRNQSIADGVIDFAAAVEQEDNKAYMKDAYHIGDGLHPNKEGGKVMADRILSEWMMGEVK